MTVSLVPTASELKADSLVSILCARADIHPEREALIFLDNAVLEETGSRRLLTFGALHARACCLGRSLETLTRPGDRVVLAFPPGLDFVTAFVGCLYAGRVAVPVYPPGKGRRIWRAASAAANCGASLVLTCDTLLPTLQSLLDGSGDLDPIPVHDLADLSAGESDWQPSVPASTDIAFLQYTSGSTGDPKGVIITHGNLLANQVQIARSFRTTPEDVCFSWLPVYHDMGLIGTVLGSLYQAVPAYLTAPATFIREPMFWLEAVSRFRVTVSGGPNFAYDLCCRSVRPEHLETLDLSSWRLAFNGAEPVRASTLAHFAETFAPHGFRAEAAYPCYGMAETTLLVSGGAGGVAPRVDHFDEDALTARRAEPHEEGRPLVSCGSLMEEMDLVIADTETGAPLSPGRIGEIQLAGPNVTGGYWQRPDLNETFFVDRDERGRFLRTGDLGFLHEDHLYISGRLKEMLIIRGRNYFPQDLEQVVSESHVALHGQAAAAFTTEDGQFVMVHEVARTAIRRLDTAEVEAAARSALSRDFALSLDRLVLVKPGRIPKTSSGKIRRGVCREDLVEGRLEALKSRAKAPKKAAAAAPALTPTERELVRIIAAELGLPHGQPERDQPLNSYGPDSMSALRLQHRLEREMGAQLTAAHLLDGTTLAQLAELCTAGAGETALPEGKLPEQLPLSANQRALWFYEQMNPGSTAYAISFAVDIQAPFDSARLARTFDLLAARHPVLATVIASPDGEPVQRIDSKCLPRLEHIDGTDWDEAALTDYLTARAAEPFDLAAGPLVQAFLVQRGPAATLVIHAHHIITDFWSLVVLMREWGLLYEHPEQALPQPGLGFYHQVARETAFLASPRGERELAWWRKALAGDLPLLELPTDRPRPAVLDDAVDTHLFLLDAEPAEALRRAAARYRVTPFNILLAGFAALLHRAGGQDELLLGTPTGGRHDSSLEQTVGYLVNPIVLRSRLHPGLSFADFLAKTAAHTRVAMAHAALPFQVLVEQIPHARESNRAPIFQVMFTYLSSPYQPDAGALGLGHADTRMNLGPLSLSARDLALHHSPFELSLLMAETRTGLIGRFEYNTSLFSAATAARLGRGLHNLLTAALAEPDRPLVQLNLLDEEERRRLLDTWNPVTTMPAPACLHEQIARQVATTPEREAVIFQETVLTYAELWERAQALAHRLTTLGAGPEVAVGVCLERGDNLPAALLGILSAGAAYVPMAADYPDQRLAVILEDSRIDLVVCDRTTAGRFGDRAVRVDEPADQQPGRLCSPTPENLAYAIYTSGSTGKPKAVGVPHATVSRFFTAMDRVLGEDKAGGTWLAVTRATFDISVLELLFTLTRGFRVVIQSVDEGGIFGGRAQVSQRPMAFSLFYFADGEDRGDPDEKYRLLMEGARFADEHGFSAVWTPERHFHNFGGLYPNPSVTGAAVAAVTRRVRIRAGSLVLPLHNPVRATEDWSVVDNLSGGRVDIAFASGWNADDFIFQPANYKNNKEVLYRELERVRDLWRGEPVTMENGNGEMVSVKILPRPRQPELPVWLTTAGNIETFKTAGRIGASVLTHLLGQDPDDLSERIAAYRAAYRGAGRGHVTLMLHTFVGDDLETVREKVREPFTQYLRSSFGLMKGLARQHGLDPDDPSFTEEMREQLLAGSFDRFFESSALFGTPELCLATVERLKLLDVDEVACLIDFGLDYNDTMAGLEQLAILRRQANPAGDEAPKDTSLAAQLTEHGVTHLQCTPSMVRLLLSDARVRAGLGGLRHLLLGGEALPQPLLDELRALTPAAIHNMYGPTETTIWSTSQILDDRVLIGRPLAGQQAYIVDAYLQPVPEGRPGELLIGGCGVTRGYLRRPGLTAERFVPFDGGPGGRLPHAEPGARFYLTGDRCRYRADGRIEFLGRVDHQIKLRGHRIELPEIEHALSLLPGVARAAAVIRNTPGGQPQLIAFFVAGDETPDEARLREGLRQSLPPHMIPARFIALPHMPLNSAGKIDRTALKQAETGKSASSDGPVAPPRTEVERRIAEIWGEVLGRDQVGIHDSFFELGGHSLLLTRVHASLTKAFKREISMVDLFRYPTISALAGLLAEPQAETAAPVVKARTVAPVDFPDHAVAVIGLACRFPGADGPRAFWDVLREGRETITFFSDEELLAAGVPPEQLADPSFVKASPVLSDIEGFDADLFGYSPREAAWLDPQHRLFLECAWEAMESAAYRGGDPRYRVGVFAGSGMNTYLLNNLYPHGGALGADDFQIMIAGDKDFLPSRTAYKLDLKGPGVSVQTGCSTSLVAVDVAVQALLTGRCDMALAGAASVRVPHIDGYHYKEGMIASPDGHCRAFDADAGGSIFGSGAGAVLLKPLARALADGDTVHAVIRGSATNNDGNAKISYTAPSIEGQIEVIRAALHNAEVTPESIGFIEGHGTATELGDPIEVAALQQVFAGTEAGGRVLGSVKSNMGHLDTAAGVAGLLKCVLALSNRALPPTVHFREPNPKSGLETSPFRVNDQLLDWQSEGPRRAGVSSFGIGGTNAHLVLEEAPPLPPSDGLDGPALVLLSAAQPDALEQATERLADHLAETPEQNLADVAYSLQVGRKPLSRRRMLIAADREEAAHALLACDPERVFSRTASENPPVAFLFPGGAVQYPGMGRELYQRFPTFRDSVDRCARILIPQLGRDPRRLLFPEPGDEEAAAVELRRISLSLPAIFTTSYATAQLLLSRGIRPDAMIGHSLGEYVAACLADVFSLEDALSLVVFRGQLFEQVPTGAMLSVALPEAELVPLLDDSLSLAIVNGPHNCAVSGTPEAVGRLEERLAARDVDARRLHIDVPAHSHLLDPILDRFAEFVARLGPQAPRRRFVSNVTGTWITAEEATDPGYWARHLRRTVRFGAGLETLLAEPHRVLLELGPGTSLTTLARRHPAYRRAHLAQSAMRHPNDARDARTVLLEAIGKLWLAGVEPDWTAFHVDARRRRVPLPTYPFQRKRYWIDPPKHARPAGAAPPPGQVLYAPATGEVREDEDWVAPRTETERELAVIWRQVLGVTDAGAFTNFFELGGDSLLATRVNSRLRERFSIQLPLKALFENPTLAALGRLVDSHEPEAQLPPVTPQPRDGDLPLSFAQQRLWFLDQFEGPSATYNMKEALALHGLLDVAALQDAITYLVERHEVLRTTFPAREGKPHQVITTELGVPLAVFDFSRLPEEGRTDAAEHLIDREVQRPFLLDEGPLVRFSLLRLAADAHVLVVTKHHIISDGWSIGLIIREISRCYEQRVLGGVPSLEPLAIQYADFAAWQRRNLDGDVRESQLRYWVDHLEGSPALLELPWDRPRPRLQTYRGAKVGFHIDPRLTDAAKGLAREHGATLFMVLEAVFAVLLHRYSGQDEVCLGSPVANRNRSEIEPLVGFFVNTLVMRNDLRGKP
ncbi:MAG: LLM class flavin-dependent oxidoreductase, partial [Acidobacteriota bacterium]|nr:LLM class flavin-dependent oxidoreductase [Acidobacteriota bacterium]